MIFKKLCLTAACTALISVAGVAAAQSAPSIAQVAENSKEAVPTAFDPVAHKRVLGISEQLRCLVCQNQSIADSNAELAVMISSSMRGVLTKKSSSTWSTATATSCSTTRPLRRAR